MYGQDVKKKKKEKKRKKVNDVRVKKSERDHKMPFQSRVSFLSRFHGGGCERNFDVSYIRGKHNSRLVYARLQSPEVLRRDSNDKFRTSAANYT